MKQAVYVLPDSANAREDFEWLKPEIEEVGGQAAVFAAHHIDSHADDQLIEVLGHQPQHLLRSPRERELPVCIAAACGSRVRGLAWTACHRHGLLEQGIVLFESLYRAFDKAAAHSRPRPVARAKTSRARKRR